MLDAAALTGNTVVCTDAIAYLQQLPPETRFHVVIADPPYNIGKDFGNDSDSQPLETYIAWSKEWIELCLARLHENGIIYMYGFPEIVAHISVNFPLNKQRWLAWHYTNKAVPKQRFWQRSHESILCLWKSEQPPRLNVDRIRTPYTENYRKVIGNVRKATPGRFNKHLRTTTYNGHALGALPRDVLSFPALAGGAGYAGRWSYCFDCATAYPGAEKAAHATHNTLNHPTQKPAPLTEKLLGSMFPTDNNAEDQIVAFIPFAGSGSECVVARDLGVTFYASELNPQYVALANAWLHKTAPTSDAHAAAPLWAEQSDAENAP